MAWLRRDERGQSLVELALLMPILIFGLIAAADLARAFSAQLAVQNAARAGAEAAAINGADTTAEVTPYVEAELIVPGLDPDDAVVTYAATNTGGVDRVSVTVQYTWTTLVAWPLVPNSATFERTVQMRAWR